MTITLTTPTNSVFPGYRQGEVIVSGTYTTSPTGISRSLDGGDWVNVVTSPSGGEFVDSFEVVAGSHTVQYRFDNDVGVTSSVINVVCCPTILAGIAQSNLSGRLTNNQTLVPASSGAVAYNFTNNDDYEVMSDPFDDNTGVDDISFDANAAGSWMLRFANLWLADKDTELATIVATKGGTTIAKWQHDSDFRDGGPFNLYESMTRRYARSNGASFILSEIGETDAFLNTEASEYKSDLIRVVTKAYEDFKLRTILIPLHQIDDTDYDGVSSTTGQAAIRAAQIEAASECPYLTIAPPTTGIALDTEVVGGDGVHFKTDAEGLEIATIAYDFISPLTFRNKVSKGSMLVCNGSSGISCPTIGNVFASKRIVIEGYVKWSGVDGYLYAQQPPTGADREFALFIFSGDLYIRAGATTTNLGEVSVNIQEILYGSNLETTIDIENGTVQFVTENSSSGVFNFVPSNERLEGVRFTLGGRAGSSTPNDTSMSGFVPDGTVIGDHSVTITRANDSIDSFFYKIPVAGTKVKESGGNDAIVIGGTGATSDFISIVEEGQATLTTSMEPTVDEVKDKFVKNIKSTLTTKITN